MKKQNLEDKAKIENVNPKKSMNEEYKGVFLYSEYVKDLCGIEYGIYPENYPGELESWMKKQKIF